MASRPKSKSLYGENMISKADRDFIRSIARYLVSRFNEVDKLLYSYDEKYNIPIVLEKVDGLEERVAILETHISWIKHKLEKLDQRFWWIITGLILSTLVTILTRLI